jgi:hypothetical protein
MIAKSGLLEVPAAKDKQAKSFLLSDAVPAKIPNIYMMRQNHILNRLYVILQDTGPWISCSKAMNTRKTLTFGCKFGLMIINNEFIHCELS